MSALAKLALSKNILVSGSDDHLSQITKNLSDLGAKICLHKNLEGVRKCDLFVYTVAVNKRSPDFELALKLKKTILERAEFLELVAKNYKEVIAISGTHGKTTTTAMIASIMKEKNPTVHIGGEVDEFGGNLKIGKKDIFITEACEFNKSFLHLTPSILVVTNIECDHMDCYKNLEEIQSTFLQFIYKTTDFVVLNHNFLHLCDQNFANSKICTFDIDKKCDFWATNLTSEKGCYTFDVFNGNFYLGKIELSVPGKHSVLNALASIAVGVNSGISFEKIKKALKNFCNVHRRFEKLYDKSIKVFTDYSHHPTEIKCAIETAKEFSPNRLFCIFQPHTYTRTKALFNDFLTCFTGCDELLLVPTYSAREQSIEGGDSFDLFKKLPDDLNSIYFKEMKSLKNYLSKVIKNGDIILWIGAGDIDKTAKEFVAELP